MGRLSVADWMLLVGKVLVAVTVFDLIVIAVLIVSIRFRGFQRDKTSSEIRRTGREYRSRQRVLRSLGSNLEAAAVRVDTNGPVPSQ